MNFTFFSPADEMLFVRNDAEEAVWTQETYTLTAAFPSVAGKDIQRGQRVGFTDPDGTFQAFEIRSAKSLEPDGAQSFEAEHIAVAELSDEYLESLTPTNATPANALSMALQGTLWRIGTVTATNRAGAEIKDKNAWKAVCEIRDAWKLRVTPRVTFGPNGITGRFLDAEPDAPVLRGLRLSMNRNIDKAGVTYDDRELATALYGFGKSVNVGDGSYQKVTFAGKAWAKSAGKPADKPAGQRYVEDAEATAAFGRNGRARFASVTFNEVEDADELLQKTWERLQEINKPRLSIELTVADLKRLGYLGEALRLGEGAMVEIEPRGLKVEAKIIKLSVDLIHPDKTKPTIGNSIEDIVSINRQTAANASQGARVAQANPNLLDGYIDTMKTAIMSSQTMRYTDPTDGGDTYVTADGSKAMHLTGAGLLLASGKTAGGFDWRTAITGAGIVADEINAGTLRASLVTILGNSNFYWDAANIVLQNPRAANNQIRIGQYDGVNLGIGFTKDGGLSWSTAIGFGGAQFGATMAGWNIGDNGLYTPSNALYLGISPITATIAGQSRSVIFKAGDGFGVSKEGVLYAKSGEFGGNVYANNIQVGGAKGYVTGGQIGNRTLKDNHFAELYAKQAAINSLEATVADITKLVTGAATVGSLRVQFMAYAGADSSNFRSVGWRLPNETSGYTLGT